MIHNINEGFYKNVSTNPYETEAIQLLNYYTNVADHLESQIADVDKFIREACGGKLSSNYRNTIFNNRGMAKIYADKYKTTAASLKTSMLDGKLDAYMDSPYARNYTNNIFAIDICRGRFRIDGVNLVFLSPDTVCKDPSNLNDLNKIFNITGLANQSVQLIIVLYGFKNLKEFDVKKVFGVNSHSCSLSLYIIDCPKLADSININTRDNIPACKGRYKDELNLIYFPDKTSTYSPLQIMRKFHIVNTVMGATNYFYPKRKTGTEFVGDTNDDPTPKISKAAPASTATPVSVATTGDKVDDLPLLIKKDKNLIYTIDGTEPIGKITRDGKHIYKGNSATIWFIVGDDHVCRTKKGVALYRLG